MIFNTILDGAERRKGRQRKIKKEEAAGTQKRDITRISETITFLAGWGERIAAVHIFVYV